MIAVKNVYDQVYTYGINNEELDDIRRYNSLLQQEEFQSNKFKK